MTYLLAIIFSVIIAGTGSQKDPLKAADSSSHRTGKHKMSISEVLKKYTDSWMKIPGVVGTGEGKSEGKPCVIVFMNCNSKLIKKKIPKTVDGYKVVFEETGEIKAR
jgi:hypothetical protein